MADRDKESVDFDRVAHDEAVKLHGDRPPQPGLADRKRDEKGRITHSDNITVVANPVPYARRSSAAVVHTTSLSNAIGSAPHLSAR